MLTVTQAFLNECKGCTYLDFYSDRDAGMLVDAARSNWWIAPGPGMSRPAAWINEERKPIPRATAEALLAATVASGGGLVMPDGSIAYLAWGDPGADDLTLIPGV
jgi:hypothetical protein